MANMTKNGTTGRYELSITPSSSAQTKRIKVAGKYCDCDIDVIVNAQNAAVLGSPVGVDSISDVTVTTTGASSTSYYSIKASGTIKIVVSTAGYIAAGETTKSFSAFKVGEIKKSTGMTTSSSSSGSYKTSITPGTSLKYVNCPYGYIDTAHYVTVARVNGFGDSGICAGASSGYTIFLNKDEVGICLSDSTTLYYGTSSSVGTSNSVSVQGGAVIYWDGSAWRVRDYDDSPNTTILGTQVTIYLRVNSGKRLRKLSLKFSTS